MGCVCFLLFVCLFVVIFVWSCCVAHNFPSFSSSIKMWKNRERECCWYLESGFEWIIVCEREKEESIYINGMGLVSIGRRMWLLRGLQWSARLEQRSLVSACSPCCVRGSVHLSWMMRTRQKNSGKILLAPFTYSTDGFSRETCVIQNIIE